MKKIQYTTLILYLILSIGAFLAYTQFTLCL